MTHSLFNKTHRPYGCAPFGITAFIVENKGMPPSRISWAAPEGAYPTCIMNTKTRRHAMTQAYIGLDVHKTTISIAIAFFGNDAPVSYGKCSSDINVQVELAGLPSLPRQRRQC